ncbi:hypothetical protein DEA41_11200 [Vibrio anguillarum]|uniref:Uncharacterized protein n=1 Tax=Vibrio anguillarum TaxID=55601 RepID=A0ABD4KN00_VIBAN|nr:hypothetical protein DEA41_11200 [Vibrio anguillarum]MBF4240293.1 hypothetical protein [Vibrio anguillarum]MBF4254719.1 hypothetical protein [Vibrio anguillarum]MBF4259919.1 hypothetical protein [Vibrio anguillarum]MBF4272877.1 hypothetical protein [Vibrio anguillarum]
MVKPWPEVKAMNKMPTLRMPSWGLVVKSLNLWGVADCSMICSTIPHFRANDVCAFGIILQP